MHQGFAWLGLCQRFSEHRLNGTHCSEGGGGACIDRASNGGQYMGCERHQSLHVFQACVEITAGNHRAVQGLEKFSGDADQLIFDSGGLRSPGNNFAPREARPIEVVLVGHQTGQPMPVGDAGFITGVIEQPQSTVRGFTGIAAFGYDKHREMIGDMLSQHRHRWGAGGLQRGHGHQATRSMIWWCST